MNGRISAATRVSIGLALMTASIFWTAQAIGLVPDTSRAMLEGRRNLCESVAVYSSAAVLRGKPEAVRAATQAVMARNPDVLSAALRRADGKIFFQSGDHRKYWQAPAGDASTPEFVRVPIFAGESQWGTAEIAFKSTGLHGVWAVIYSTTFKLSVFVVALGFFGYRIYLRKTLAYLDPASVIPDRVRSLLDTLGEGVLVLDERERILLANKVFTGAAGIEMKDLVGRKPSELPWHATKESADPTTRATPGAADLPAEHPWTAALRTGELQTAVVLRIDGKGGTPRALSTNCAPIVGDRGDRRGALVTFNDITSVEEKNGQLREMLTVLEHSRDEIDRQNKELQLLATIDPLTGCRNRRSFFVELETHWGAARRYGQPLTAIMVDVDHFKKINDQHGHAVGDQVLQRVAQLLKSGVRDCDIVGRYGGEEFCILLPHSDIDAAAVTAERLRASINAVPLGNVRVSASLGVAAMGPGIHLPQDLLEQADKSLYAAKRTGRNRVVRRDALTPEILAEQSAAAAAKAHAASAEPVAAMTPISFHVVTSLMTALAHRDRSTAEHSQRVAALCVETASGVMSAKDCFTLEVAALLHDVGKMGVPDAILHKPAELNEAEWKVMRTHEEMGESIIAAAFASHELTEIVRTHHAFFGGCAEHPDLPTGENITMGARVLSIADAYDAIVSNRVYRAGRDKDIAFAELRRCAGTQFDPELVERFIVTVNARDESRPNSASAEVPPHTALRLRLELGILACAAGAEDIAGLSKAARHMADLAATGGMGAIAQQATRIQDAAGADPDLDKIKSLTAELVDLCRSVRADGPNGGERSEPSSMLKGVA